MEKSISKKFDIEVVHERCTVVLWDNAKGKEYIGDATSESKYASNFYD